MFLSKKQQQDECLRMRAELMDYHTECFFQSCNKRFESYTKTMVDALRNGVAIQHSFAEQANTATEEEMKMAEQEIHHISSMSDDEVRRVYFATFKRRRPIKE